MTREPGQGDDAVPAGAPPTREGAPSGRIPRLDEDPFVGTVVGGRYRLLEKIGEGGAGAVYRGVHEALRKPVAVKLLGRAARADKEVVTRFEREAVAAANLKHPNIVEATDYGQTADGTLYLVMEFVEGSSLRAILEKEGRLPPARALHLIRQVCAAVSFAHGREVVHRDLKPENVVVHSNGDQHDLVKVIDFGIARMRSSFGGGPSGLTQVGTVVGTVEYMAPEQAMGQAVDARADQYAIGVIAFELLTGRPPYVTDEVARLIYMHVGAPIPRATELAPGLPPGVDDVLTRMLGKLPDERFPTLSDALAALTIALERPPGAVSPAVPAAQPKPIAPAAPVAPVQPAAPGMLVTPSGTIVVPQMLPSAARPAPKRPGLALSRKQAEILILLVAATVSVIGLVVILFVILRQVDAPPPTDPAVSPSTPGAQPTDGPPNLAPTSHDPGRMKVKDHGRPHHGGN